MNTLHDFMMVTKGVEYLIAISTIVLFALFWILLDRKDTKNKARR